jgi:hypothetical protein
MRVCMGDERVEATTKSRCDRSVYTPSSPVPPGLTSTRLSTCHPRTSHLARSTSSSSLRSASIHPKSRNDRKTCLCFGVLFSGMTRPDGPKSSRGSVGCVSIRFDCQDDHRRKDLEQPRSNGITANLGWSRPFCPYGGERVYRIWTVSSCRVMFSR